MSGGGSGHVWARVLAAGRDQPGKKKRPFPRLLGYRFKQAGAHDQSVCSVPVDGHQVVNLQVAGDGGSRLAHAYRLQGARVDFEGADVNIRAPPEGDLSETGKTWADRTSGDLFEHQETYTWRPYRRPRGMADKARFWEDDSDRTLPRVPTGMDGSS